MKIENLPKRVSIDQNNEAQLSNAAAAAVMTSRLWFPSVASSLVAILQTLSIWMKDSGTCLHACMHDLSFCPLLLGQSSDELVIMYRLLLGGLLNTEETYNQTINIAHDIFTSRLTNS